MYRVVDLILVLPEISKVTVATTLNPPKSLSRNLVMDVLAAYKSRSSNIHAQAKEVAVTDLPYHWLVVEVKLQEPGLPAS